MLRTAASTASEHGGQGHRARAIASAQPSVPRRRPSPGRRRCPRAQCPPRRVPPRPASADVHVRAADRVGLGPPQHLAGHRRDLAETEQQEPQELLDRVALGPGEVDVRDGSGVVADPERQGGQGVGAPTEPSPSSPGSARGAPRRARASRPSKSLGSTTVTSTKITSGSTGRSWSRRSWRILSTYSSASRSLGLVGDQPDRASRAVADEDLAGGVEVDLGRPQLEDPLDPRGERDGDDRQDEAGADLHAVRPLDHVADGRVGEAPA